MGWDFEVRTGADPTLLANLRCLAGYRRSERVDGALCAEVMTRIQGPEPIEQVQARLSEVDPSGRSLSAILHLLWTGELTANLLRCLSLRTVIDRSERSMNRAG